VGRRRRNAADLMGYAAVRSLGGMLGALPDSVAYPAAEALGSVVYRLDRRHRAIGMTNLAFAFPERPMGWRLRVLEASFRQVGVHVVEASRLNRLSAETIRRKADYEEGFGLEHFEAARREADGGILFVTAHVSAWELLPLAHAVRGRPLSFVVRPLENPRLDRWISRWRNRFGNRLISKHGSIRRLLKAMKDGWDVGLLIDQNVQEKDGVFAPFFGRPACTTAAAALLALRTGAPVVAGFILPTLVRGRYRIRFYPPMKAEGAASNPLDVVETTSRFNRRVEEVVREYPHCWLWGHRRFQTQPDGRDPYAQRLDERSPAE
jgi:Kdo2-lipid IVA lauroyltransferase/acyltransferase